jgi:hypothetical protein
LEISAVLTLVGSINIFLLGLLLTAIKNVRGDMVGLEERIEKHVDHTKEELIDKIGTPQCDKAMKLLQKEIVLDMKELIVNGGKYDRKQG